MVSATHSGTGYRCRGSSVGQVDDFAHDPTFDGAIGDATVRAHTITNLANEFNVPAAPIAQGVSKLAAAIKPPNRYGGSGPPDADAISRAIDDIVMALVGKPTPDTPGQALQVAPSGGAHDTGNGGSGNSGGSTTASGTDANGHYADANGKFPDANGRYADANGKYPDANGRYADANGRYPDANGRYADANGNYPDANGRYADANGHYPDSSGHYSATTPSSGVASAGGTRQYSSEEMDYVRRQLTAMGIAPGQAERIIAGLEAQLGGGYAGQATTASTASNSPYAYGQGSSYSAGTDNVGGSGKPGRSTLSVRGSQFGQDHHYRLRNGVEEFNVATSDRQPGFWNMPRSEGAFLQDKFTSNNPHSFSAAYTIKSGNGFCIAQLFNNSSNGHPQLMVMYKNGAIDIGGTKIPMPLGQKFNLEIQAGSNGTRVFVDNKLVAQQPLRHQGGDNYFRYGAYLQGRTKAVPPPTSALVEVSGASVRAQ